MTVKTLLCIRKVNLLYKYEVYGLPCKSLKRIFSIDLNFCFLDFFQIKKPWPYAGIFKKCRNFNPCLMCHSGTLPVEYLRGKPLCMKQYEQLMSSCRIPGLKTDSLMFYGKSSTCPRHITVVHNCQVRSIPSQFEVKHLSLSYSVSSVYS